MVAAVAVTTVSTTATAVAVADCGLESAGAQVVKRLIGGGEIDAGGKEPVNGVTPLWLAARFGQVCHALLLRSKLCM